MITMTLLIGIGGLVWLLASTEIPDNNQEHVWTLLGVIGTLATQSCMWWFGSSKGSSDKTMLIRNTDGTT